MIQILRETHETPKIVEYALRMAGGTNWFGEPNYRAVWGWNRLAWIGGKFEDRDEHGKLIREVVQMRMEPKYPQVNRWHIERWCPPELYGSPRSWYAQTVEYESGKSVPALGPYPTRGDYEHCFALETPRGEFLQLTPTVARYIARAIEFSRGSRSTQRKAAIFKREAKEDSDYDSWAYDMLDDACPAFNSRPFVSVA